MKKLIIIMSVLFFLNGCTTSTSFGECIGINDTPNPNLVYKASYWNLFLAFVFSETIIVPVVVVLNNIKCPVSKQ